MTGADGEVDKSPSDHRAYRWLQLPSGLKVLLIHDPQIGTQTGADGSHADAAGRQRHPGEHDVLTDDDDLNSLMSREGGSSGSGESGSDDDADSDGASGSEGAGGNEGRKKGRQEGGVKKAAAAMSVGIGYFSDPWQLQGLSHYLEHMLFMGSEKYPDENDYDAFLSSQGGASNACTEEEATTFHFDCDPGALRPALDRFAQFFVAPLLKADALGREVQAVDNEFAGVVQSGDCRLSQLRAHTARAGHVASKFGWGNRKSLVDGPTAAGIDVRAELLRHYERQYSAERMNLVVMGGEPLDTLQAWASELFAPVAAGCGSRPSYEGEGQAYDGGRLYVLPATRREHRLSVLFQLPCLAGEYRKKAEEYLSHLIGHEGAGSLLAELKARGWASELCAGVTDTSSAGWMFDVEITLTEAGLAQGPGCGLAAVGLVFEYLAMLRAVGPQRWAWDEMALIAAMKFRFQEEEDAAEYVAQLAANMHVYPPRHAVAGPYLHEEFDPGLISRLLESMTPAAARLDLQTHDFEGCKAAAAAVVGPGAIATGEEPWFGFTYAHASLPAELLVRWEAAAPSSVVRLPPKNDYLPSDFSLRCGDDDDAAVTAGDEGAAAADGSGPPVPAAAFPSPPEMLLDEPGLRLWHKTDRAFRQPRTNAYFRVACPAAYATPRAAAATHLLMKLLEEALCQEAYLADVAGLHYGLWFEGAQGIDIKVEGFSHKLPLLVGLIFRTLAALCFADDDFARVKETLVRNYVNSKAKPLKHSSYLRLRALRQAMWDVEAVRSELEALSAADARAFLPELLAGTHLEALLFGNVTAREAAAVAGAARAALGSRGAGMPGDRAAALPPRSSLLCREAACNAEEDNSVAEVYLQCGPAADPAARAVLDLVDQLAHEPCYDVLRTKEQLGYTVHSGARLTHGVLGFCVVVQSGTYGPAHLDARIDAFLAGFRERLACMDATEFEQHRAALLAAKLQRDRNMLEESDRAWDAVVSRGRDFGARADEVAALRRATLEQVIEFFSTALVPGAPERRKLAVHVVARAHAAELATAAPEGGAEVVADLDALKRRLTFYPPVAAQPAAAAHRSRRAK